MSSSTRSLDAVIAASASAYRVWSRTSRRCRATALIMIADALDSAADPLVALADAETRLREPRLRSELQRTTFQLRLFAEALGQGRFLDARIDHADPDWPMAPRPDLRRIAQALGPVVVYAASNFPFAFSVVGGDTASALAAGASVIVKTHPGHPRLSRMTARVVAESLASAGAPDGVFAVIDDYYDGIRALRDPRVKAGAFTGSIGGGRALFDVASSRADPIPFFGELGSVNPVVVTTAAARRRGDAIARDFLTSLTLGGGQLCTKPGALIVPEDSTIVGYLGDAVLPDGQPMLNERLLAGYASVLKELTSHASVRVLAHGTALHAAAAPATLLLTSLGHVAANRERLFRECFGPAALVVTYRREEDVLDFVRSIEGQLTATVIAEDDDALAPALVDELREKAGRLLWNQWPTGVSVTFAQQHGGPYPATTAPQSTSVGTAAIDRFLRPVSFQGFPGSLLPDELTDEPNSPVERWVDNSLDCYVPN